MKPIDWNFVILAKSGIQRGPGMKIPGYSVATCFPHAREWRIDVVGVTPV